MTELRKTSTFAHTKFDVAGSDEALQDEKSKHLGHEETDLPY